ncbi:MAG: hypothetical protein HYS74_01420 [Parcubacteria group bacterium]|nr:hypothetical protein [Parcubacteria group bacterium]
MRFLQLLAAGLISLSVPITSAAAEELGCGERKEILRSLKEFGEEIVGQGVRIAVNERAEKEWGALVTITAAPWEKDGTFSILGTEPSTKKETCLGKTGRYWKTLDTRSRERLRNIFPALFADTDTVSGGFVDESFMLLLIVHSDGVWEFRRLFAQMMFDLPPDVILSGEGWEFIHDGNGNGGGL